MTRKIGIPLYLLLTLSFFAQSQEVNTYNFRQFRQETVLLFKQPSKWKLKDWLILGGVGVSTMLVMQLDCPIHYAVVKDHRYAENLVFEAGNQYGGFFFSPALSIGLYAYGSFAKKNKAKKIGFELAQAALYGETISYSGKYISGRTRPRHIETNTSYHPFTFGNSVYNSFPAGHVVNAVAVSTVLAKNTHSPVLKMLAYVPAALTMVSRIYQDAHWTSDVFMGAALGYCVGSWVVNLHENPDSRVQLSSLYPLSIKVKLDSK